MSDTIVESAIAMPDIEPERVSNANGLKRRGSKDVEQESKRQRISPGKSSPIDNKTEEVEKRDSPNEAKAESKDEQQPQPGGPRRKSSAIVDEKQRSKRLFGSLLGNLNQPRDRTSKRREGIEARRKAELQRQDDERLEDKKRRTEKLAEQRRKAQKVVDEENMRMRHSNLLNAANYLQTTSEPRLYYRPWELRSDEEDRIEEQLKDAQAQIDRELALFEVRELETKSSEDAPQPDDTAESVQPTQQDAAGNQAMPDEAAEEAGQDKTEEKEAQAKSPDHTDHDKPAVDDIPVPDATDDNAEAEPASAEDAALGAEEQERHAEDDGDHVVEGDEDTVIY